MKTISQVINEMFYEDSLKRDVNVQIKVPTLHEKPIYSLYATDGEEFHYHIYNDFRVKLDEFRQNKLKNLAECRVIFKVMIFDANDAVKGDQLIDECLFTICQIYKDGKHDDSTIISDRFLGRMGSVLDDAFKKRLVKQMKKEFDNTTGLSFKLNPNVWRDCLY